MYMKNSQSGFVPLLVALIAALSIGGGVWAYKSYEHKKEIKLDPEKTRADIEIKQESKQAGVDSNSKSDEGYGEDYPDRFGDDGYEDEDEDKDDDNGGVDIVRLPPVPAPTSAKAFTMADVKTHNSSSSCWTVVSGNVYDVTNWIARHPGGSGAIKGMCGVDASSAFNGQHGGQSRPVSELAGFKIGVLK